MRSTDLRRFLLVTFLSLAPTSLALTGCAHHPEDYSGLSEQYILFFETNSAELTNDGYAIVQHAADAASKLHPQSVVVAAYSDKVGSEAANHQISKQRAALVEKTLADLGVDPSILVTLPLGPANDNLGPTGDRRIEIHLITDTSAPPGPSVTQPK